MSASDLPPIPLLQLGATPPDDVVLETWREALSGVLGGELPHSLFALWIYDDAGEATLVGPAALAEDGLTLPRAAPRVPTSELERLEDIVRRAGYASVVVRGAQLDDRDTGLVLMADFERGRYDGSRIEFLERALAAIAPTLARVARLKAGKTGETGGSDVPGWLVAELGAAVRDVGTPKAFAARLSEALKGWIPHERLELIVNDPVHEDFYRLGAHDHGTLWSDPALVVPADDFEGAALAGSSGRFVAADTEVEGQRPAWPRSGSRTRSVAGTELPGGDRVIGWLLVGSEPPSLYSADDAVRLAAVAPLVAARVETFLLAFQAQVLRSHVAVLRSVPASLARAAELLATTAQLGVATRLVAREAQALIPSSRLELALRTGHEDEAVILEPGEARPLAELQPIATSGTGLGRVLSGELPTAFESGTRDRAAASIVVPLRVAGRITGALVLHGDGLNRADAALAQQLADVLAPHLELGRRTAALSAGWAGGRAGKPAAPARSRRVDG